MVEDNTHSEQDPPVKRRSRLFGGRKAARKAAESSALALPVTGEARTPALPDPTSPGTVDRPATRAAADSSAAPNGQATTSTDVKVSVNDSTGSDTTTGENIEAGSGEPWLEPELSQAPAAPQTPAPRTTTSLLFQAPDIQPLPPRAGSGRRDREFDDDFDDYDRRDGAAAGGREGRDANRDRDRDSRDNRDRDSRDRDSRDNRDRDSRDRDRDNRDRDSARDNRSGGRGDNRSDTRSDNRADNGDFDDDRAARDSDADTTVRRRTRRRSGDESRLPDDLPPNTVVKVRPPRQVQAPELITEPQRIKGSTRLEAKKQRRRDGRDAGRRRPVITEAEFLARRESVDRSMIVRSSHDRIQIGVLEDGVLVEHYVAKAAEASLIGNVYLGRVQNVLPSMEAAFVDIGRGRNAVLYSGEVDWDAADTGNQPRRIELALKPGDTVLVQVTKDPVGHKGARLTSQLSLPGRYLVYVPNGNMNGISRKLPDTERARLKKILKEVLPENVGVIVRTAAEGASEEQLTLDVNRLISQWAAISTQVKTLQAPAQLHGEPDLLIKIIRDVFNEDFHKLVISGSDARSTIETYLAQVAPDLVDRIEVYEGQNDIFDQYRISEQIEKALDRKVWLPSGGSLVIDRTEAMTVVDVNTGKFVGSGGNLEETVTKNNLEAADEVVRQMRLRDIGGIIVVDFIDMVLESNRDLVLRRLVECLSRDRTKHQVAEVTSLGLVQMTRKKLGLGLLESFSEPCEVCAGRGVIVQHDPSSKHRGQQQTPQPERRARSKGGNGGNGGGNSGNGSNGNGNGNGNSNGSNGNGSSSSNGSSHAPGVTHSITPAAQSALAKIAASTIAAANGVKPEHAHGAASTPATDAALSELVATLEESVSMGSNADHAAPDAAPALSADASAARADVAQGTGEPSSTAEPTEPAPEQASAEPSQRSRRNSRRSRSQRAAAGADAQPAEGVVATESAAVFAESAPASSGAATAPVTSAPAESTPVTSTAPASGGHTELPLFDIPAAAAPQRRKREDAAKMLDSVLEALPEPKQPGQGRSRSRRVSTAALSAPVTPTIDKKTD
ncbi:ribonuclease E/G [Subtercola vilae]|uniref:ribonuclease E/G n=1 Tax=Subtercola vilae TaxID=2056433 RepID=UPI001EEDB7A9|nr:Rne/Rng family ribonuclease [Subtercola vilae]